MNRKKYTVIIVAVLLACVSLIAAGTVANYTYEATARNVITSGGLDIEIVEQQLVDGQLKPYPGDSAIKVMPSNVVSKIVTVKNNDSKAFIRAKYDIVVTDSKGEVLDVDDSIIWAESDNSDWVKKSVDDGWFYYKEALDTDKTTTPLINEVHFSGANIDNKYVDCTVKVIIYAEGLQADNNGLDVMEAKGWTEK